jgi:formyltetrahydrofolate deformylase
MIGDAKGNPDNERMVQLFDEYKVDYIVLARYMRLIPPATCWKFAGGRIINLHHGLLPSRQVRSSPLTTSGSASRPTQ